MDFTTPHMPALDDQNAERERAGSRALSTFARVLSARILRAHADGALTSNELDARLGWAAKASLRVAISNLCELGVLVRTDLNDGRRASVTELTPAGGELLAVADVLEHWLSRSPFGPISLPDTAARGVVRALVAGWNANIVRELAEGPRSLAELSTEIDHHSYPALKRRLAMLRSVNLVAPVNGKTRSPAHEATQWLRRAIGPLSAAGRWERNHAAPSTASLSRLELEAALLLVLPLAELPAGAAGECVLAAPASQTVGNGDEPALAAVSVVAADGKLLSVSSGASSTPATWALGTPGAWLDAIIDGNCDALRLRGADVGLVEALVAGVHEALFPA